MEEIKVVQKSGSIEFDFDGTKAQINNILAEYKGMIFTGKADIVLAGVTRSYDIKFTTLANTSSELELLGKKTLLFTDFGLTPPSKLGGTIKVKNELDVEFKLLLKKAST